MYGFAPLDGVVSCDRVGGDVVKVLACGFRADRVVVMSDDSCVWIGV